MKHSISLIFILFLSFCTLHSQEKLNEDVQEQKRENVHIKIKEGSTPNVYIDGEQYDYKIFQLLDPKKIKSISVIRGEQAKREYNAPNGVLIVITKEDTVLNNIQIVQRKPENKSVPKLIIDGKESNQEALSKLSPEDIQSIEVVKTKEAKTKYNTTNDVIIVTTKNRN